MGLSFHYSGSIAKPELLSELITEVQEIANVYQWKYHVYDTVFPDGEFGKTNYNSHIYGISFTPPECETISICFLSNGRMSDTAHLIFFGKTETQDESKYLYMLSVKTQFAGIESHQLIIHLIRHLNQKYFSNFKLSDEGKYWETNDFDVLKKNFKNYTAILDGFSLALQTFPVNKGENIENYLERMMKEVNRNLKL